jgi:hypothetical protein
MRACARYADEHELLALRNNASLVLGGDWRVTRITEREVDLSLLHYVLTHARIGQPLRKEGRRPRDAGDAEGRRVNEEIEKKRLFLSSMAASELEGMKSSTLHA